MKFSFLIFICTFCSLLINTVAQGQISALKKEVYRSEMLVIIQLTPNAYQHISYLQTNDFGNVPCNGLLIMDNHEAIVFDTPTNDKSAEELIKWIKKERSSSIIAVIPTHFHEDCLGGLAAFHKFNIPSYGSFGTIELTKVNHIVSPQIGFNDSLQLNIGNTYAYLKFFGEGHTKDNVVGYFPKEKILFGGCLIKELNATKGFLGDANLGQWSNTVEKVKHQYRNVSIVIPGHGEIGGMDLLDYTIKLFRSP